MAAIPTLLSALVCEQIIIETGTQKKTLVNVFDTLTSETLPAVRALGIFVRLTDLDGSYKVEIRVVHVAGLEERLIGKLTMKDVEVHEPGIFVDVALNLPPAAYQDYGRYEFQIWANDDLYLGRTFIDVQRPK